MRRLIVSEFVSLDGVMEAPGGEKTHPHTGWVFDFQSPEQDEFKMKETMDSEALLLGRKTYEGFAAAWPQRGGDFADKFNSMPKYVASTTLSEPLEWSNSTLLQGDVPEAIRKLKEEEGGPIVVHGSATLVHTLLENDLVDELRLLVFPVTLGSGIRVFPETEAKRTLKLVDAQTFSSGVQALTYEPAR